MFSTPLLRAINLSIAVLILAVLGSVYQFAWRPLPQTSGRLDAPIQGRATIVRDAIGVPHITAASWQDAIFLQGYVTAQDRLWEMEAIRRLAAGQLAEIVGPRGVDSDEEARRLRLLRLADAQAKTMNPGDKAVLAAYARGVNYFIDTHRNNLPIEFTLLRFDPRPWEIRDSLLAALQMHRTLTTSWRSKLIKLHMLEHGDPAKLEFLFPSHSEAEPHAGSNAWAIPGARSATGKPILASDPHLEYSLPSTWYMVHLQAPDLDVTGVALPGLPGVIIGHNQRIGWGVTNLEFDVQDLYREQFDQKSGRYLFQGQLEQARLEREVIAVKGENPMEFGTWITRHGPIVLSDEGKSYSLRWTAADETRLDYPFLDIDRAQNWQEFTAALARFPGPPQNFVYADVDGNIGYQAAGHIPERKPECSAGVPADGTAGDCEWVGIVPFEQMPHFSNPASGAVISANQNLFPEDSPYPVHGNFAPPYRAKQIQARLGSKATWQPQEMLEIQKDVYSAFSDFLAHQIVAAWDANGHHEAALHDPVEILRAWNGQMEISSPAPMLITLTFDQLRKAIAEKASPGSGSFYNPAMAPVAVERLLREQPQDWFTDYNSLLLKCLTDAIAEGVQTQGSKISRWDYGRFNTLRIPNLVAGSLPLVGKYLGIGPVPMSGSPTTVKQMARTVGPPLGPSMRMIVDFSNLDRSLQNITVGESGQPLSFHYKDQWDAYYIGHSFPMQFQTVEAVHTLTVEPK